LRELWLNLDLKINRLERIIREETPEAFAVTDGVERKCYEKVINLGVTG
jgi:hypothetical protein